MANIQSQSSNHNHNYFQFEADFVASLQCIPMQVRMKLDNCGVKLKLAHWNQFSQQERQTLVDLPCNNESECQAYKNWLQNLVTLKTGQPAKELAVDPHPAWLNNEQIPDSVLTKAQSCKVNLSLEQWHNLTSPQRFALVKLSRPSHENQNFMPALQEFGIVAAT